MDLPKANNHTGRRTPRGYVIDDQGKYYKWQTKTGMNENADDSDKISFHSAQRSARGGYRGGMRGGAADVRERRAQSLSDSYHSPSHSESENSDDESAGADEQHALILIQTKWQQTIREYDGLPGSPAMLRAYLFQHDV